MFFRLKSFLSFFSSLVLGVCMHIRIHPNIFSRKKKGRGRNGRRKDSKCFVCLFVCCFCCFCFCFWFCFLFVCLFVCFSAIALAGIHIPWKSHNFVMNQKRVPTCATSTAASGCVQSFNHLGLHFQLKKKIQTQLNSKPGSLSKICFFFFFFFFFLRVFYFFVLFLFCFFKYRPIKSMPIYFCKQCTTNLHR